ncbi:aminotransferase class V-fold PLP-dependent enzyme [Pseudoduganella violacea]|uniref:cysteine desulfurase n=1 Tax=Pseudoduganella violacea TaxID=1715466 RepID=A0A7W5BF38_9BURK|nr:aminotransferase class V-fold PLP-dependent enzyme [Pseudoduganella violacea]MBB3121979.1 cysteine sulfinate desulfinase/cysteine desulfurase-like protein/rhodanese-related sulfurtransferase [Pseudoduganella violacea]
MSTEIYLDGNATTAVLPAAIDAALHAMGADFGNPSSSHGAGLKAKVLLDGARACARRLLGVGEGRLIFNSGATEGIQTAVLSALCAIRERRAAGQRVGSLLVYGATEHKAVPEALAHWNRLLGLDLLLYALPVDAGGRHDLDALRALAPEAALVCTMAANNETGVISDLDGIGAALAHSNTLWMVDCVQGLGKLALNLQATRIDYAPFSGHKLFAPKGIGMLYVRAGAPFTPLIMGGGQETGLRSGTENMAGIAALGAVLQALEEGNTFRSHAELEGFRARLAASLRRALPGIVFNAAFEHTLPTTLNFSVPGLASRELLDVFDAAAVRVSSGSACSAAKAAPSYVLQAMGLPDWRSSSAIRMSFGATIDSATIDDACARIERCGAALRSAGLLPDAKVPPAADGVVQLSDAGRHSWLVLDAASRAAAVIDAQPALQARIDALLHSGGYTLRASLRTDAADTIAPVRLGARLLLPCRVADATIYLLGRADAAQTTLAPAAVRHAFTGQAALAPLADLLGADSLICPASETQSAFCTSLRAEARAGQTAADDVNLDAAGLAAFLQSNPNVLLVDVREAYEHAASAGGPGGRAALNIPLSRLAQQIEAWQQSPSQPLVFFCRSGNRSAKAVHCLRRLGHSQCWHLVGGMALTSAAPILALAA